MFSFSALPAALMAFLLVSPVFSEPTTPNDAFHAIAIYSQRHPEHPICRLTPPSPAESIEGDVLLTFEEWKAKQFAMQSQAKARTKEANRSVAPQAHVDGGNKDDQLAEPIGVPVPSVPPSVDSDGDNPPEMRSPHFRVPLTDRFNYASLDCSARVHLAHRTAKSPASILSSKKDRYMLSPCGSSKGQNQFVVVELCEDIRIDTVQLANFEFFSGVFKDFTVSVAKTYSTDTEGWTVAGTYKAKNVRGVQSFHPPTSLRDFYRYIRIDFHSHYSNEFYCPVSLLRVYGLTHMEQWKWESWESESLAKRDELEEASSSVEIKDVPEPGHVSAVGGLGSDELPSNSTPEEVGSGLGKAVAVIPSALQDYLNRPIGSSRRTREALETTTASKGVHASSVAATSTPAPIINNDRGSSESISQTVHPDIITNTPIETSSSTSLPTILSSVNLSPSFSSEDATTTRVSSSVAAVPSSHPPYVPVPPPTMGGESIYRTIMNRLTALEANNTLYARYVEEQTAGVRDMLKRFGEEVGRLEGIGKAQAQMYQRTVTEWERQRNRLEMEHGELMSRVDYLSDEIAMEKRLGIAQLCLLLAVLVFVGLTRGSRGEAVINHGRGTTRFNRSMREWSRRNLSFNGDWGSRLKIQTATPQPLPRDFEAAKNQIEFPSPSTPPPAPVHTSRPPLPVEEAQQIKLMHALASEKRPATSALITSLMVPMNKRPRIPIALRTPTRHLNGHHHRPPFAGTASISKSMIHRTSSQDSAGFSSGVGPMPRSAKKWARSAHLHEVRGKLGNGVQDQERLRESRELRRENRENDAGDRDIRYSPASPLKGYPTDKSPQYTVRRKPLYPLSFAIDGDEGTEGDNWVDTDVEGSEMEMEINVQYSPETI